MALLSIIVGYCENNAIFHPHNQASSYVLMQLLSKRDIETMRPGQHYSVYNQTVTESASEAAAVVAVVVVTLFTAFI